MKPPIISVVTPSFNQGRFIERTIQSVLSQGIPDLEYVVMDGGSSDETVSILERYTDEIEWVSEPDGGQTDAVNKGIQRTSGAIIGWLNSDDVYFPGTLPQVGAYFDQHPDVDIIYGDAQHIDEKDDVIEPYYTEDWDQARLCEVCFLCQPAVFFRRTTVDRFGLLNDALNYCMDYEYWIRLSTRGASFAHIPHVLAGSRLYADTKTLGARVPVHEEINTMLRGHLGRVPDRWLFNYAHAVLEESNVERSERLAFVAPLAWRSVVAALRWNRSITPAMIRTLAGWVGNSVRDRKKVTSQ